MSSQGPLPYLLVNGGEVANAARTVEYLRNGLGDDCGIWTIQPGGLCSIFYHAPGNVSDTITYTSPQADPAPWYQATIPESSEFLGVVLLDLNGYDSPVTRVVTNRIQGLGGAIFSGQRRNPRTWTFRAALVSASDRGAAYGLRWLIEELSNTECDDCGTGNIEVRLACPLEDGSDDTVGQWISYSTVLTDGPHEVDKFAPRIPSLNDTLAGNRAIVTVEWTMTSGNPLLYKPAETRLAAEQIGFTSTCTDICDWLFGDPGPVHCVSADPPAQGTLAPIYTFIGGPEGMGPLLLEAYDAVIGRHHGPGCPPGVGDQPVARLQIGGVPANGWVIVDCAQRKITVATPDGNGGFVETDGTSIINLSDYVTTLQWPESRDCDTVNCFCARYAHPCSQGTTTTVQIDTQLREG